MLFVESLKYLKIGLNSVMVQLGLNIEHFSGVLGVFTLQFFFPLTIEIDVSVLHICTWQFSSEKEKCLLPRFSI